MVTMTRVLMIGAVLALAGAAAPAVEMLPAADVMMKVEMEDYGLSAGLSEVKMDEASDGVAMAMAGHARVGGGLNLEPGRYTLLLRTFAPAGDADGFFVEIAGERTRRTAPIGRWATVAFPFRVAEAGLVPIVVLGQEPGMTVDQLAVVRGEYDDGGVDFAQIPAPAQDRTVDPTDLPLQVAPVRLAELPDAPFEAGEATLHHQDFEGTTAGASGEFHVGEGRWGEGVHLNMPDGRYDVDTSGLELGPVGTVEWWVKLRPAAQGWWDQGWRYFLHARPAEPGGFQLDLWRHHRTQLRLSATMGMEPFQPIDYPEERIEIGTSSVDNEQWHHLLVSWDLTGERQRVWLLLDGAGHELSVPAGTFAPGSFASVELGNRPSGWATPHIPMDGGIDEVHISNTSVATRLAQ
ncbi:MAG: LamG-like jellyroll fold domain-containing protein [Armatimonadota bacterium]|jgi:hypothetical protein